MLHTVEVMAPADAIPESITIDLAGLDFHDSVHVSAVKLPEGCRPVSSKTDLTVVTIVPPTVMVEETPAAPAAAARGSPGARPPRLRPALPAKGDAAKGAAAPAAARERPRPPPQQAGGQEVRRPPPRGGLARGPTSAADSRTSIEDPMLVIAGTRQSGRASRAQPPQHRLHGG